MGGCRDGRVMKTVGVVWLFGDHQTGCSSERLGAAS